MDFFDVINKRASCRAFVPGDVSDSRLEQILDAGVRAPTAFTYEPWHFIVVRDTDTLARLGGVQDCNADATAAIVAVGDPQQSDFWREDLSAAIENMHLAATALGLASLWVAVLPEKEAIVRDALELPEALQPLAIMPIGKAAEPVTQAPRKPLADVCHRETFGRAWTRSRQLPK